MTAHRIALFAALHQFAVAEHSFAGFTLRCALLRALGFRADRVNRAGFTDYSALRA